ncbi:hypothetical protein PoB_007313500 [Plakobranchus ocellatus]|uniref:Secreted protein n=1 Tax=Plakobranchus ocellatus TaxID=259542 RepID=A0AAV4DR57_9GAST|nr:hypothetical protein PoB_007313500 [Plakobranchus ocellatus]
MSPALMVLTVLLVCDGGGGGGGATNQSLLDTPLAVCELNSDINMVPGKHRDFPNGCTSTWSCANQPASQPAGSATPVRSSKRCQQAVCLPLSMRYRKPGGGGSVALSCCQLTVPVPSSIDVLAAKLARG